ncbi:hypothetical protein CERSUDRAFT_118153 [Gelatoporia subvermispora B]|uniref:N-acetyl-D-glucosamine kinase n=1 Tax=Ceriporiopsis subvermispora (strain B) TaxID=914234 RepID=M2QLR2_CERS8|nr:hypothetical protein CERSUDRAFT_118153 [Gelatoporia subvermispora B]
MSLHLCIDCGGSKTLAVIAGPDGSILARAAGGPSNFAYLGLSSFLAVIQSTVSIALASLPPPYAPASAALPPTSPLFVTAWLGVSGVDSDAAIAEITPPLEQLLGVYPRVCNDTHLLAAPLGLYSDVDAAVAAVAGTGGIVSSFRRGTDGELLAPLGRVGGWGWVLGDEGGGFHAGREAVRALLAEEDRWSVWGPASKPRPQSALKTRMLAHFGVTDVFELLTIVHYPDPPAEHTPDEGTPAWKAVPREKRLSSLAPLVFAAAFTDGDALALSVLRATARALADQISLLLRPEEPAPAANGSFAPLYPPDPSSFAPSATPSSPAPLTVKASNSILCAGGSLFGVDLYRALILDELAARGHVFKRVEVVGDTAEAGAKALAMSARQN